MSTPASTASPVDRLGRALSELRISVIDRCNFRCSFCMPPGQTYDFLPHRELLTFEELARVASIAATLGVRKIRLTGGEPLLRRDLPHLVSLLRAEPAIEELALTTNGTLLPKMASPLRDAGLDRVSVSLESLDDATFGRINGVGHGVGPVLAGIEAALDAGLGPVKINTVVLKGVNDHEIPAIASHFKRPGCIVRFIEYMDVGTVNCWSAREVVSAREIVERIAVEHPLEPLERARPSDVALRYRYLDDGNEVGVIASITQPFCGDCTRLRLSSEGRLYTCLFGAHGVDLKTPLRSGANDSELLELIRATWSNRSDRYSEERADRIAGRSALVGLGSKEAPDRRVEMFRIGG